MLVDLTPEALQERLRRGQGLPGRRASRRRSRTSSGSTTSRRCASSSLRELAEDVEARRHHDGARPAQPAGGRRADPRAGHAGAALAADPAARVPLRAAARLGDRRALGAQAGPGAERGGDGVARGAAPAREHPRRALHRARGRRPRRDRQAASSRERGSTYRLRRHARRVAPHARSSAARSSRRSSASCPGSTSASSPTARSARSRSGEPHGRPRRGRWSSLAAALVVVALRTRQPQAGARGSRRGCSSRSPAARSTRRCSRRRIRIARAEDATLVPAYLIVVPLEQPEDAPMQQQVTIAMPLLEAVEHAALRAGVPVDARVESGRTPIHALQAPLGGRALRPDRRPGPASGRTAGLHAEGPDLDAHARAERDVDPPARSGVDRLTTRHAIADACQPSNARYLFRKAGWARNSHSFHRPPWFRVKRRSRRL